MSHKVRSLDLQVRLAELHASLEAAERLNANDIARQIMVIGFRCMRCGDCCKGEENSVVVFPFEIRRIMAALGCQWLEAVEPPIDGEWDTEGNFHTLEWRIKKRSGSCGFFLNGNCEIYGARPLLCSTYPFYLDGNGVLRCSECRGLKVEMDLAEAKKMAVQIIERSRIEILEAMALIERYGGFERGGRLKNGDCIVHDSEGEHRISLDLISDGA
jgi:Fe-S-cluster containining protein